MDTLLNSVKEYFAKITPYLGTIRFKLAFLYSFILFLFASGLVLGFNLFLSSSLNRDPEPTFVQFIPFGHPATYIFDDFSKLQFDERKRIKEIRLNDLRNVQQMSIISLIPLAGISFIAGYYLSGKFLDPLSRLKKDIEKIESKDLGIRFDSDSDDEVGALIQSFNDLSTRLQESFQSQELFVQDASHELRTPLTIIQTNLDTVLDNEDATKEEMSVAVKQALIGVSQLKKLVNYLLELTTVKHREFSPVSLKDLLQSQVEPFSGSAIPIKLKLPKDTTSIKVLGDELLLGRVVQNLLENALKYSQQIDNRYWPIIINLKVTNSTAVIRISNHGETISKENLEKLFQRFFQVDPSRSKKLGGYGLGLSIAKKVVEEHNGKITATSNDNITVFEVTLPTIK